MLTKIELSEKEQVFFKGYLETMLFTETGDCEQPEPDCKICPSFLRRSLIDCLSFYSRIDCYLDAAELFSDEDLEQAGHDFWLTRNGHGVGFWSRKEIYGETYAKMFSEIAKNYGESHFQEDF